MVNNEENSNTKNINQLSTFNIESLIDRIKERFKTINKPKENEDKVKSKTIEDVPINEQKTDSKMENQYGRTRVGYLSGLYFNSKPYLYDNGGNI